MTYQSLFSITVIMRDMGTPIICYEKVFSPGFSSGKIFQEVKFLFCWFIHDESCLFRCPESQKSLVLPGMGSFPKTIYSGSSGEPDKILNTEKICLHSFENRIGFGEFIHKKYFLYYFLSSDRDEAGIFTKPSLTYPQSYEGIPTITALCHFTGIVQWK